MTSIRPIATIPVSAPPPRQVTKTPQRLADPVPSTYGASPQQAAQTALTRISTKYAYDQSNLAEADAARARVTAAAKSVGRNVTLPSEPIPQPPPIVRDDQRDYPKGAESGGRLDMTV